MSQIIKYPNFLDMPHAQSRFDSGFGAKSNIGFALLPTHEEFVPFSLASTCVGLEQTLNFNNKSFRELRSLFSLPKNINVIG